MAKVRVRNGVPALIDGDLPDGDYDVDSSMYVFTEALPATALFDVSGNPINPDGTAREVAPPAPELFDASGKPINADGTPREVPQS